MAAGNGVVVRRSGWPPPSAEGDRQEARISRSKANSEAAAMIRLVEIQDSSANRSMQDHLGHADVHDGDAVNQEISGGGSALTGLAAERISQ